MKKIFKLLLILVIFFNIHSCVLAENSSDSGPNNVFGIHITDENNLGDAADLVNSNGGDWGYITFVITERERDHDRWQKFFDEARRLHLIPIVRIATKADGDNWTIPQDSEINNWIAFLNSLNWVIQNRYVVIGNEPNHTTEWGGKIEPEAYATYLNNFAVKLHQASPDFFVLPAGLDASAKSTKDTMDESIFIKRMLNAEPNLFNNLDGWTSHSYPNPNFSGKETDTGRGTIQTFSWELSYLQSLGITKSLPVFITETGWSNQTNDAGEITSKYEYAFKNVWNDKRIVAVTPFILNYPDSLFAQFSWKKNDGSFYPYYNGYKNIQKIAGKPVQIESGQILGALAQPVIFSGSDFVGAVLAKNTGQSIWTSEGINLVNDDRSLNISSNLLFNTDPYKNAFIVFKASSPQKSGILLKTVYLTDIDGIRITNSFPIEGVFVKVDKVQIQSLFAKISSYLRSAINTQIKGP